MPGGPWCGIFAPVPETLDAAQLASIIAATDYLVVNELEAQRAARCSASSARISRPPRLMRPPSGTTCIVTAGAKGVFTFTRHLHSHAEALKIVPVDTTGAGDAFVGILAAGLHNGDDIASASADACLGASLACLKLGAQPALPNRNELVQAKTKLPRPPKPLEA